MSMGQAVGKTANRDTECLADKHTRSDIALLQPMLSQARSAWNWLQSRRSAQLAARRLRVAETLSLGEKRFVSILEVDGTQYLIGGSAGNVQLLTRLEKQGACS